MQDPIEGRLRYLVHYSDGGSGMRFRAEPLSSVVLPTPSQPVTKPPRVHSNLHSIPGRDWT
jgi:hypothetical protein